MATGRRNIRRNRIALRTGNRRNGEFPDSAERGHGKPDWERTGVSGVTIVLLALIKSAVVLFILLTGFAYTTLLERKLLAGMQVRIGPNRAGPWGLFQPVADGIKV